MMHRRSNAAGAFWRRRGLPRRIAVACARLLVLAPAIAAAAIVASLFGDAPRAHAATKTVNMTNFAFTDVSSNTSTTTIAVGDTVNWVWVSGTHSTCSGNSCSPPSTPPNTTQPWSSGTFANPHSFSKVFTVAGTYTYLCEIHAGTMEGTVVVQASGLGGTDTDLAASDGSPARLAANDGDDGRTALLPAVALALVATAAAGAGALALVRIRSR